MIKFPVRYNREDESIEDAEFDVIAHPFISAGMSIEQKHEIGMEISKALNASNGQIFPSDQNKPVAPPSSPSQAHHAYTLPDSVKSSLSERHKKSLDRIERKHKKFVAKLIAKYPMNQGGQTA